MTVVAIYARKSTEDERSAEDGRSVDRQVALARAFATRQGWVIAESWVITEEASGADFTRPGLVRLLEGARHRPRPFDVVVLMSIDRLGREQVRMAMAMQTLRTAGVSVWTYQDGQEVRFTTPVEKLMLGVRGFGAEEYRHQVQLKTREALRRKAALGHFTGQRTYGYTTKRVGSHTERVINEEQASVVRRIFEMSAAGYGDSRIVGALAADKIPAPGRRGWSKQIIKKMLRNDLYRGVLIYGRTQAADEYGKRRVTAPADRVTVEVPALQIVGDDLWRRVQARKAKTRAHYLRAPDGKLMGKPESGLIARHLLSGIARCGVCGGSLSYMGRWRGARTRYYCLERAQRGPSACPSSHGILMAELDEAVRQSLYELLAGNGEAVAALCEERDARLRAEQATQGDRREDALREAAVLEKEIGNLVAALASGAASPDVTQAINERRAKVEILKATPPEPARFDRAEFFRRFEGVRKIAMLLEPSYPAQVRQVIRKLGIERIMVTPVDGGWEFSGLAGLDRIMVTPVDSFDPDEPRWGLEPLSRLLIKKGPPASAGISGDHSPGVIGLG